MKHTLALHHEGQRAAYPLAQDYHHRRGRHPGSLTGGDPSGPTSGSLSGSAAKYAPSLPTHSSSRTFAIRLAPLCARATCSTRCS